MKIEPWVGLTTDDFYHKPEISNRKWVSVNKSRDRPNGEVTTSIRSDFMASARKAPQSPSISGCKTEDVGPLSDGFHGDATSAGMKLELPPCQICPNSGFKLSRQPDLSAAVGVATQQHDLFI